jgi:hypothetical protein
MKAQFTHHQGTGRKPLVKAIEKLTGRKGAYCMNGAMKYAFDFGDGLELHRDGTLKAEIDITGLLASLAEQGYEATVIEPAEPTDAEETTESEVLYFPEHPHEDWENCAEDFREIDGLPPKKRKGIMDVLVEELNANEAENGAGGYWERLHTPPTIIDERGREHNFDGTFASTAPAEDPPAFEDLRLDEREELGLGRTRRDPVGENGMSASEVPDTITIELPSTNVMPGMLKALLNSKNSLIEAALGEDCAWEREYGTDGLPLCDLPIEFDESEGKVKFEWLRFGTDADTVKAWSAFLAAAVKFSKGVKRVMAKDAAVENEKFAFRTFMVKIGMNDAENKAWRRQLCRKLKGDSAFATEGSKQRWLAKHGSKKNAEVAENEISE